jgi:hypothetical protein
MRTPNALEQVALKVEHVIRARHASTGQPIEPLEAVWDEKPSPRGKQLKVVGGTVVVAMDQRLRPEPPKPGTPTPPKIKLRVVIPDGPVAWRLSDTEKELDIEPIVDTDAVNHVVEFGPIPMTLTVDLVRPGAGPNGGPSTGKTVEARASSGTRVPLPEVAGTPGTYRSPARVWTAGFNPLDLLVGNTLVRRIAIDFARTDTQVTVVDPT